jgi:hypothetical protein
VGETAVPTLGPDVELHRLGKEPARPDPVADLTGEERNVGVKSA